MCSARIGVRLKKNKFKNFQCVLRVRAYGTMCDAHAMGDERHHVLTAHNLITFAAGSVRCTVVLMVDHAVDYLAPGPEGRVSLPGCHTQLGR